MKVNKYALPIVALVMLLGTVGMARATGYWQTRGRDMVNLGAGIRAEDIRGWMTLQDVADGTGIPVSELGTLFGLPADVPATTAMKELESWLPVSQARAVVAQHLAE